jgi:hypothetical protein
LQIACLPFQAPSQQPESAYGGSNQAHSGYAQKESHPWHDGALASLFTNSNLSPFTKIFKKALQSQTFIHYLTK